MLRRLGLGLLESHSVGSVLDLRTPQQQCPILDRGCDQASCGRYPRAQGPGPRPAP